MIARLTYTVLHELATREDAEREHAALVDAMRSRTVTTATAKPEAEQGNVDTPADGAEPS
jgi:hypothetical protein